MVPCPTEHDDDLCGCQTRPIRVSAALMNSSSASSSMSMPPPLMLREFGHVAAVLAASHCQHAVLTGSCALNVYLPRAYAIDVNDVDFFLHYDSDDSSNADVIRDATIRRFLADVRTHFNTTAAKHGFDTSRLELRVGSFWHSGVMTYQLSYGAVHFADITTVPYRRAAAIQRVFPRTVTTVVLPSGCASPPLHVSVASLDELLHRVVSTIQCCRTLDGFNGISSSVNAWRIAKDGKRLQRIYDLFRRRLVTVMPQPWLMDAATPYLHTVPIDKAACLPVFGRPVHTEILAAFRDALTRVSGVFGVMENRLDGFATRVRRCTADATFLQKHAASKERSRRRQDDALLRTRNRLKVVNEQARAACKSAFETIDDLRLTVLMAQKETERMYSQIIKHTRDIDETVTAAVCCTGTDVTLTSFCTNFTSIAAAVSDAQLLPFSLFSGKTCGLPMQRPPGALATDVMGETYADSLRVLFANTMVATLVVTMEMLQRSRAAESATADATEHDSDTSDTDASCHSTSSGSSIRSGFGLGSGLGSGSGSSLSLDTGDLNPDTRCHATSRRSSKQSSKQSCYVIEPGWKDTGEMLGQLALHVRSLRLDSTRRAVPIISKAGQLSIRIMEIEDSDGEAQGVHRHPRASKRDASNGVLYTKGSSGVKSKSTLLCAEGMDLPLRDSEKDAVFAMCDSFITVLTTPLLAHACAIGGSVRKVAASAESLRSVMASLRKPETSAVYQKLIASKATAQLLRRLTRDGFVQ